MRVALECGVWGKYEPIAWLTGRDNKSIAMNSLGREERGTQTEAWGIQVCPHQYETARSALPGESAPGPVGVRENVELAHRLLQVELPDHTRPTK